MAKTYCIFLLVLMVVLAVSGQYHTFTKKDCELGSGEGLCPIPSIFDYWWDDSSAACVPVLGRCVKSRNNFRNKGDCERIARRICYDRNRNYHNMRNIYTDEMGK